MVNLYAASASTANFVRWHFIIFIIILLYIYIKSIFYGFAGDSFPTQSKPFDFDEHFTEMIQRKKTDHTYRVFRKVNRKANDFPKAYDYTYQEKPKDITVWCSNDYLGMSRHDSVVNAAKYVYFTLLCFILFINSL